MKREIKFRAWDSLENRWYEPTFEGCRGKIEEIMLSPRGRLTMRTMTELIDESMFPNRFELMQYTGLHDKNGRSIYEGDIVHAYDQEPDRDEPDYRGSEATGIVEFHGSMFMLDDDIVLDYPPILEVIGNIFENTEMLEGKQ
ncbi:YopX family protein [Lacticaseibacillus paracasei]|uniref:YopX family protein n=1 Tax=Lacticaseibacillus paracasei TaxID=1597 RepID=UPI0023586E62|nr:YopX family protein [Lacticaseibacillus paracasei]WCZ16042.1 hypothetical protein HKJ34_06655 [Lacticaseibacillus paracasei]